MSSDKYRLYFDNFYSITDYSYIELAGIDLLRAKSLENVFDTVEELIDFRIQLQGMSIDEVKKLIFDQDAQSLKLIDTEFSSFISKVDQELDKAYPLYGLNATEQAEVLKKKASERQFAIDEFKRNKIDISEETKASIYRDFCIVNRRIADKMNLSPLEWEQQKMRAKFEVEAEKAWASKVQSQDYQELVLDETLKKAEEDQIRAEKLGERFVKLPNIVDSQLNFQRSLAFNGLIEAGMLDEAEKVLVVYENLNDSVKRALYGDNLKSMDESY